MMITRIDPRRPDAKALQAAVAALRRGGLVVFPTETAYGLACDPASAKAVQRLFSVKERDRSKPLPLIAASMAQVRRVARLAGFSAALAEAFWPGPLSLVLLAKKRASKSSGRTEMTRIFARGVANRDGEIAMRVSPNPVASALARRLGRPVAATSANRSGRPTRYDVPSVLADLGTLPDVVLDAGPLKRTMPSTLVRCQMPDAGGRCDILREGPVSVRAIARALTSVLRDRARHPGPHSSTPAREGRAAAERKRRLRSASARKRSRKASL